MIASVHVLQLSQDLENGHFRENDEIKKTVIRNRIFCLADATTVVLANSRYHHENLSVESEAVNSRHSYGFGLMGKQRSYKRKFIDIETKEMRGTVGYIVNHIRVESETSDINEIAAFLLPPGSRAGD